MFKHTNRLLAAGAAIAAAGAIVVGDVTAASAARPGTVRVGTEYLQIMQAAIPGTATVIAHGAFTASGTASATLSKIIFPHGTFRLRVTPPVGPTRFNPVTCLGSDHQHGTYQISGGTGTYRGITGHGRYRLNTLFVAARNANGTCSHSKEPVGFQLAGWASGPVRR
jgi:hypothetical protein